MRPAGTAGRIAHATMAALFAFAAILQVNDPDPLRWVLLYAGACGASLPPALGRWPPVVATASLALLAFGWAAAILAGGPAPSDYLRMFDAWEMRSEPIEEAREAAGLLVVGAWMAYLTAGAARDARSPAAEA